MLINRHKEGTEYIDLTLISPVRQPNGEISHYLAIKEDITEPKIIEEENRNLAFSDPLTIKASLPASPFQQIIF